MFPRSSLSIKIKYYVIHGQFKGGGEGDRDGPNNYHHKAHAHFFVFFQNPGCKQEHCCGK